MFIIKPLVIDPATEVTNLSVPMDDVYPVWDTLLQYQRGDIVVTGEGEAQKIWEARHAVVTPIDQSSSLPNLYNQGMDPLQTNVVGRNNDGSLVPNATEYNYFGEGWWRDATDDKYLANRYRMFDHNPAFYTESDVNISFTIKPTGIWSGVALFNVIADSVTITLNGGPEPYTATRNLRYEQVLSQEFQNELQVAFVGLPLIDSAIHPDATLDVGLSVSAPRFQRIGYFCIGEAVEVGQAVYGLSTELMDYSRFERDPFGNIFTIRRGYSDKVTYPYVIPASDLDQVRQILVARRATLTAYIGHPEVPLTITYGYFVDLDIPIDNWGQSEASIVVESVLYDTPGTTESLPNVVEFIDPTLECINETEGRVIEACLVNGSVTEQVTASIVGMVVDPSDSVSWELIWVIGDSEVPGVGGNLVTGCSQYLPTFTWPETVPAEQLPATALVKATVTKADQSVVTLEPATLIVRECEGGRCPCSTEIVSYGWYNDYSGEYNLAEDDAFIEVQMMLIPPGGLAISGSEGEFKYYNANLVCTEHNTWDWEVEISGADANNVKIYMEKGEEVPTTSSSRRKTGKGVYAPSSPWCWSNTNLNILVEFLGDVSDARIEVRYTCEPYKC